MRFVPSFAGCRSRSKELTIALSLRADAVEIKPEMTGFYLAEFSVRPSASDPRRIPN